MSKKTILVTGAAGFIGFHLVGRLVENGGTVIGYDNLNDYYEVGLKHKRLELLGNYENFTFVNGDLADYQQLNDVFQRYRPSYVVNLAAQAGVRYSLENPKAYMDSNITGFFHILEMCRNTDVEHLVYASSSSVYGANKKTPFSTEDPTDHPVSFYAASKKCNENMAYAYSHLFSIPATGLRFFTVYGSYGRPDMAYFSFTKAIIEGKPIKVFNHGDLYRDFTYIDDIVHGMERIIPQPPMKDLNGTRHKVYNIGNHQPVKLMDFIACLEELIGKPAKKEFYPMQPGDVYQTYADISDLQNDFQFKPNTPLRDGLKTFVDWYIDNYQP